MYSVQEVPVDSNFIFFLDLLCPEVFKTAETLFGIAFFNFDLGYFLCRGAVITPTSNKTGGLNSQCFNTSL